MRVLYVVFQNLGRMRMRMGCLRHEEASVHSLADALAALPGMERVEIRPFTGSILVLHDPRELPPTRIIEAVKEHMDATHVIFPGEERPEEVEREMVREAVLSGSRVAKAATRVVEEIDLEVLRASNGSVSLGTLAAIGFFGLGAMEVFGSGKLPLPSWHDLWWRAFQTFRASEKKVIEQDRRSFNREIALAAAESS